MNKSNDIFNFLHKYVIGGIYNKNVNVLRLVVKYIIVNVAPTSKGSWMYKMDGLNIYVVDCGDDYAVTVDYTLCQPNDWQICLNKKGVNVYENYI